MVKPSSVTYAWALGVGPKAYHQFSGSLVIPLNSVI